MKNFFSKLLNLKTQDRDANLDSAKAALEAEMGPRDEVDRKIDALFNLLVDYYGSDKLVIKAGKMDALQYVRSPKRGERVLALQRIINENPTIKEVPKDDELLNILEQLTEQFSDILARRWWRMIWRRRWQSALRKIIRIKLRT